MLSTTPVPVPSPAGFAGTGMPSPTPTPSDTTPDAFSFDAVTGATRSTVVTSNQITPTGYDASAAISIVGGEYQIGAGSWTSGSGTISPGSAVRVRLTSSASYSTLATATLTIGGVSGDFDVTTEATPSPTSTRADSTAVTSDSTAFTADKDS